MASFVPSYFNACSLGGAHLEGELARILQHWEDHFPHLFLTLTDFHKCEEDVAYVRCKKLEVSTFQMLTSRQLDWTSLQKIKAYLLRTGFLMGSQVPHDPLEQRHQALRELTHLIDQLVASSIADEPSDVEPNLTLVMPPTRHQSNRQAWTCSWARAIHSQVKPDTPFSHKHLQFTITRKPPMTCVHAKAHLALTTASAPPAGTTTGTTALTVDVADENMLHAWVSGMKPVCTPLQTYGRCLAASATSCGVVADSSPLASTSTQTLDDSPTPMWTLDGPSASRVGSVEHLPFLHSKLIHWMHRHMQWSKVHIFHWYVACNWVVVVPNVPCIM